MFLTLKSVPGPENVKTQTRALKERPSPAFPQVAYHEMQAVQTVSCEGQDRAPSRRDLAGKLLPVHLALIQVKDGAHSEFPGGIKTP